MKIVQPHARITADSIAHTALAGMRHIEWCARISHRSEDAQTENSWERFIQAVVLQHGDLSVIEHVSVTVDAVVDRGVSHEWVRHRLFSYTQSSTRFINHAKKMPPEFIYPIPEIQCEQCLSGLELSYEIPDLPVGAYHSTGIESGNVKWIQCPYNLRWLLAVRESESCYRDLIADGWRPQEARSVFPNALATRIAVTGNLRSWRHLFLMRTTQETHPQFKQVMIPLLGEFKEKFPLLYDDIEPNARQIDNLKKPH